jgi:hypothetical protein
MEWEAPDPDEEFYQVFRRALMYSGIPSFQEAVFQLRKKYPEYAWNYSSFCKWTQGTVVPQAKKLDALSDLTGVPFKDLWNARYRTVERSKTPWDKRGKKYYGKPAKCGTIGGAQHHYKKKEKLCEPCREVWNLYSRDRRRTTGR